MNQLQPKDYRDHWKNVFYCGLFIFSCVWIYAMFKWGLLLGLIFGWIPGLVAGAVAGFLRNFLKD